MKSRRAVFFDRDGVLNQAVVVDGRPRHPADADSLVLTPGAAALMMDLKELDFRIICVTNQPDVARGTRTPASVEAMNDKVRFGLALDDLYCCPHDDADQCRCRKPKPGMLLEAAEKWSLDLPSCWMVGDRAGDVAAGRAAGCRTVFIDLGHQEPKPDPPADHVCRSLLEAVQLIKGATVHHDARDRFEGEVVR